MNAEPETAKPTEESSSPPPGERAEERGSSAPGVWEIVGAAAVITGVTLGNAAMAIGRGARSAYQAVDPDVRRNVAWLPALGLTRLVSRTEDVQRLHDDGHRPVVFVHGWGCHPAHFAGFRQYFGLMGRTRSYAIDLTEVETLDEMADRLRRFIAEVVHFNALGDDDQIDLVGFSMGGVVARLALQDEETRARVATLVTMGTPHSGTYLARYAATPLTLDLRPGSPAMQRLAEAQEALTGADGPRTVALWSPADTVIVPAEGAQLEGAENLEIEGCTHFGFLMHPRTWETVLRLLDDAPAGGPVA